MSQQRTMMSARLQRGQPDGQSVAVPSVRLSVIRVGLGPSRRGAGLNVLLSAEGESTMKVVPGALGGTK